MEAEIRTQILDTYSHLTPKQKQIASFILEQTDRVSVMTLRELSDACGVAEPTVVRFFTNLGYRSFLEFRIDLARTSIPESGNSLGDGYWELSAEDSTDAILTKAPEAISSCLHRTAHSLDRNKIDEIAALIPKADTILFYGAGNSNTIAMDAGFRFYRMGLPAYSCENLHLSLTIVSRMQKNDLLVLISHSGQSIDTLECAKVARERGTVIVGITANMDSPLARYSDYLLLTDSRDNSTYTDAMVSRFAQMMILDILYIKARRQLGNRAEESIRLARGAIRRLKDAARD